MVDKASSKLATFSRRARYTLAFLLGLGVAAMGDITSFRNLMTYADQHDFPVNWGLPVGLDAGIPALLLLDSLRPSKFLRAAAWALSAGTVFANAAVTPDHSWVSRGLHGVMPALAILWYEAVRHLNDADDDQMDKIRFMRWVVSPVRTTRLRVRMIRWEVTSYTEALRLESAILLARAVLVSEYGRRDWRRTKRLVPVILTHQLDTGQLPTELFFRTDWQIEVRAWVQGVLLELDPDRTADLAEADQSEQDPAADPDDYAPDPWVLIWVLRDRLVPVGVSAELYAKAYGLARGHFEQFNRHITVDDLRTGLGTGKPKAAVLARLFRSAYESGPDQVIRERDSAPEQEAASESAAGPDPDPAGLIGLADDDSVPVGGAR